MTIKRVVTAIALASLMGIILPVASAQAPPCFTFTDGQTQAFQCPASFRPPTYSSVQNSPVEVSQAQQPLNQGRLEGFESLTPEPRNRTGQQTQNETSEPPTIFPEAEEQMAPEIIQVPQSNDTIFPDPEPEPQPQPEHRGTIEQPQQQQAETIEEPQQQEPIIKVPVNRTLNEKEIITIKEVGGLNKTTHEITTTTQVQGNKTTHREITTTEVPL